MGFDGRDNKREKVLRMLMNKFNMVDYEKPAGFWGPVYDGANTSVFDAPLSLLRSFYERRGEGGSFSDS